MDKDQLAWAIWSKTISFGSKNQLNLLEPISAAQMFKTKYIKTTKLKLPWDYHHTQRITSFTNGSKNIPKITTNFQRVLMERPDSSK